MKRRMKTTTKRQREAIARKVIEDAAEWLAKRKVVQYTDGICAAVIISSKRKFALSQFLLLTHPNNRYCDLYNTRIGKALRLIQPTSIECSGSSYWYPVWMEGIMISEQQNMDRRLTALAMALTMQEDMIDEYAVND